MIVHVVSFSWKPGTTDEDISRISTALDELTKLVPVVRGFVQGRDLAWREGNADYAVVAFLDTNDPRDYLEHPAHRDIVARLVLPQMASRSSVQLRLDPAAGITLVTDPDAA